MSLRKRSSRLQLYSEHCIHFLHIRCNLKYFPFCYFFLSQLYLKHALLRDRTEDKVYELLRSLVVRCFLFGTMLSIIYIIQMISNQEQTNANFFRFDFFFQFFLIFLLFVFCMCFVFFL
jgi:hypothetical protein